MDDRPWQAGCHYRFRRHQSDPLRYRLKSVLQDELRFDRADRLSATQHAARVLLELQPYAYAPSRAGEVAYVSFVINYDRSVASTRSTISARSAPAVRRALLDSPRYPSPDAGGPWCVVLAARHLFGELQGMRFEVLKTPLEIRILMAHRLTPSDSSAIVRDAANPRRAVVFIPHNSRRIAKFCKIHAYFPQSQSRNCFVSNMRRWWV